MDSQRILPLCIVVGLLIRIAIVVFVPVQPASDAGWYFARAVELGSGLGYQEDGYPTAYWPVGYPAFLAIVFDAFGSSVAVGQFANVVLWAVTLYLLHATVRKASDSIRAANLGVLLYSVHLNAVGYTALLLTETLFVCGLVLAWRLSLELVRGKWWLVVALGVLLGLMTLVKAQTWLFAVAWAVLAILFSKSDRPARLGRFTAVVVIMFATVLPWSLRNLHTFGTFVLVSTNGGAALAVGNHPKGNGTDAWEASPFREYIGQSVRDQIGAERRAKEVSWRWIRENPLDFLALAPKKFWWALVPDGESEWGFQSGYENYERYRVVFRSLRWVNQFIYLALAALAVFSIWRLLRNHWTYLRDHVIAIGFVAGYLAMFCAVTFVFNGQSRYHFPLVSLLCGLIGWTAVLGNAPHRPGITGAGAARSHGGVRVESAASLS